MTCHMKHNIPVLLFLATLLAAGAISCKKKKNDNPYGGALISMMDVSHSGSILHYRIYYDHANNVDSMIITGDGTSTGFNGYKKFSYFGSSYSITDQSNFTYTVYANTSGQVLKLLITDTTSFIYNNSLLGEIDVRTTIPAYPYYKITATNYYWQNGDVVTVRSGGVDKNYEYDVNRNGQPGDPMRIDAFLNYGRSYIKTTHLPTALTSNGVWLEKYYYIFAGNGLISQMIKVRNNGGVSVDDTTFYNYNSY